MARDTRVILSKNIKLDKSYKEVLNYSETDMLNLMRDNEHFIYEYDKLSYQSDKKVAYLKINSLLTYPMCLKATYFAFINPDYENKWFFAFIDKINYINDATVEIEYTIDVMTTWFNNVDLKQCFVVREHTMNDTIGNNTLPENLELGEYVINDKERIGLALNNYNICIGVSSLPNNFPVSDLGSRIYNGIYSGLRYFIFNDETSASKFIRAYDNERMAEAIYTIFLVPTAFIDNNTCTFYTNVTIGSQTDITLGVYLSSNDPITLFSTRQVDVPTSLNSYVPKNAKLFTYPYSYMYITNNCGGDVIYNYEDFDNNLPVFGCDGALCVGCSIKLYPRNYKKMPLDDNNKRVQYSYGINAGKYPTCSWASDSFTNWITQNAVNVGLGLVGGAAVIGAGFLTGGTALAAAGMIGGGTMSIANTLNQIYQHTAVPEQAKGNTNSGDVVTSGHEMGFTLFKMSIKSQYAKIVDDYFTRFGYKTNLTKIPNIKGRKYFNYVQIADTEVIGYGEVPNIYMDEINNIFRRGVTIWHNHSNIGNYNVNNIIV